MKKSIIITIILFFLAACDFWEGSSINEPHYSNDDFGSLFSSVILDWTQQEKAYKGALLTFDQSRTTFYIERSSVRPPEAIHMKDKIKITCTAEKVSTQEIIYTFSPHGTVFNPSATMIMDYSNLQGDPDSEQSFPKVYYIEDDGSYTEQPIFEVNKDEKLLIVKISHFSRYAMSYGK